MVEDQQKRALSALFSSIAASAASNFIDIDDLYDIKRMNASQLRQKAAKMM
jgi:hypothetical protein